MEFALEAQQLLGITLEGASVGHDFRHVAGLTDTTTHARNQGPPRDRQRQAEILKGIDLTVNAGEVHAVMGPNGSGKSTLAQVLAGNPAYEVTGGSVTYNGKDLLAMEPEVRAQEGIFLAFQYPVEIPGVSNAYFLRAAYNEIRKAQGEEEVDPLEFADLMDEKLEARRDGRAMLNAVGEHRLLRRREEAQRDPADGGARADSSRFSTRPTPGSTSTRCASSPTA